VESFDARGSNGSRCAACGHRVALHSSEAPAADYHEQYDPGAFLDALRATRIRQARFIVGRIRAAAPDATRLLDYGCGRGWFIDEARAASVVAPRLPRTGLDQNVDSALRGNAEQADAQQHRDGHWPQNQWGDGKTAWTSNQMGETALPILLMDLLARDGALVGEELRRYWPMARAAASYGGTVRDAVHALKFGGRRSLARPLGDLSREHRAGSLHAPVGPGPDSLLPVPLCRRNVTQHPEAPRPARSGLPGRSRTPPWGHGHWAGGRRWETM